MYTFFVTCVFGGLLKKTLHNTRPQGLTYMFSSNSFIASALTFTPMIYFELLLYMVWGSGSVLFIFMWISSCLNVKKFSLSPLNYPSTLVEHQLTIKLKVHFWILNSYSAPLIYTSVLMPVLYCLDYCSFVASFGIENYESSNFDFPFQVCFNYFSQLHFHMNFRMNLSICVKKPSNILIWIAVTL